jgi:hypothetical protein
LPPDNCFLIPFDFGEHDNINLLKSDHTPLTHDDGREVVLSDRTTAVVPSPDILDHSNIPLNVRGGGSGYKLSAQLMGDQLNKCVFKEHCPLPCNNLQGAKRLVCKKRWV